MNIAIDYNPVIPLTSLKVNDTPSDTIYSALFPVRRYPLQAWLNKNGPWEGLPKALRDLTRGRPFSLTFAGRDADFADLETSLSEMKAEFLHIPCYENRDEKAWVAETLNHLQLLGDYPHDHIAGRALALLQTHIEETTLSFACTDKVDDLLAALKASRGLAVIDADLAREAFPRIQKQLYGNFVRCPDSIAVRVHDASEAERCSFLAEWGINLVFQDDSRLAALREKYTVPEAIGKEYRRMGQLAELIQELLQRHRALRGVNSEIRGIHAREAEYTQNADEIRWIKRKESELKRLLDRILEKTKGV